MIPIVSVTDILVSMVGLFITMKLYISYTKSSDAIHYSFMAFSFLFALTFLFWAIPGIVSNNGHTIAFFNVAAYVCLYAAFAYLAYLGGSFLHTPRLASGAFYTLLFFGIFFAVMRLLDLQPSIPETVGDYVYWRPQYAPWLRQLTGVLTLAVTLITALAFFAGAIKNRAKKVIFVRALWLGVGMLLMLCGSLASFIFAPTAAFLGAWAGALLSIMALLAMLRGVSYKAL